MRALIANGTTVICDRYYHSGIVYSAAKENPTLSLEWARKPEVGLPRPDMVLFLDLEESQAKERGGWGGEVYEKAEIQKRVRDLFWGLSLGRVGEAVAGQDKDATLADAVEDRDFRQEEEDLVIIDASPSIEEVAQEIWTKVEPRVDIVVRGELGHVPRVVL